MVKEIRNAKGNTLHFFVVKKIVIIFFFFLWGVHVRRAQVCVVCFVVESLIWRDFDF